MVRPATLRTLKRATTALLAASIAASFASRAGAQDSPPRGALRQACMSDAQTVCAGITPGGGRIKQCMIEKFDQLSDGCKNALKQAHAQSPAK
jgi:hypothetical protein